MKFDNLFGMIRVLHKWAGNEEFISYEWITSAFYWMVRDYMEKGHFSRKEDSEEPPCSVFGSFEAMRFYFACKVALARGGNAVDNFVKLDGPLLAPLHEVMSPSFMEDLVDWIETHRDACGRCDKRAQYCKRELAENWSYFD